MEKRLEFRTAVDSPALDQFLGYGLKVLLDDIHGKWNLPCNIRQNQADSSARQMHPAHHGIEGDVDRNAGNKVKHHKHIHDQVCLRYI